MKALVLGGMFLMLGAAVGCSSSDTSSSGTGGAGGDDTTTSAGGNGQGGAGSTTSTTAVTGTTATGVTTTSTGPGEGICDSGLSVGDATTDACLGGSCCAEFNTCTGNGADPDSCIACFNAGGGALCDDALACSDSSGCFATGGICDSGLSVGDDAIDSCLGASCCDEFNACTSNGADPDTCIECFNAGGGAACDDALACSEASGCFGGGGGICDSGLSVGDDAIDSCLGSACCDEFNACTSNGADPDTCIECFNAGGGAACDDALACSEASGCFEGGGGICDSGLSVGDDAIDACLGDNCCDEFNACTSNGADPDTCIECFNAGGGAACDDALACSEASGCFN